MNQASPNLNITNVDDLTFHPHHFTGGGTQAVVLYPNGYGASIVGGADGLYGSGTDTFEVAVIKLECFDDPDSWSLCYDSGIADDVLAWQSRAEVNAILEKIARLRWALEGQR